MTTTPGACGDNLQTELQIIKGIRGIFEADKALLFLLDEHNPEGLIKNQIGAGEDWDDPVSQVMLPGIIMQTIRQRKCFVLTDVSAQPNFDPAIDAVPGIQAHSYLSAALVSNEKIFGALALINPSMRMLTEDRINLFQLQTTSLANALFHARLSLQLKLSNADLEARRWEVFNSRNTLRTLFDHLPASIYIVNRENTVAAVNMSRVHRIGESPKQVVGKKCYEKFFQRSAPCPDCGVVETLMSGQSTSRMAHEKLESGEEIEWEINTFPIFDDDGKPVQAIVTEYDVTEKKRLEAELIQSEKMAAIGLLAAGMAHEIYNPLTAILANAQMIRRTLPKVNEDLFESLELIEHAGIRAAQVIHSLLSSVQKEDLENGSVDLNTTIENSLSLLSFEIHKRSVTVHKDLQPNLPLINANQDQLQGIWNNLILNALDAIKSQEGHVTITSSYQNSEYRIVVSDNGKGIPKGKLTRIFEPYFTIKAAGQGAGLGLSLCLRMVKQQGGTIHVESQVDKGTKFTVILPASPE